MVTKFLRPVCYQLNLVTMMNDDEMTEEQQAEACQECRSFGPCTDECPVYLAQRAAEEKAAAERYEEARDRRRFGNDTWVVRAGR